MRIAYCIHSLHNTGGKERVVTIKANYLADVLGYDVHIITATLRGRKPAFTLSEKIHIHDLGVSDRYVTPKGKYSKALDKMLAEIHPDICISTCSNEVFCLSTLKSGCVKMAEFHFAHDKYILEYGSNFLGRIYGEIRTHKIEKAISGLDQFIVLTDQDKKSWEQISQNMVTINNPLTFTSTNKAELNDKRIIGVGRLCPQKNFSDTLKAWAIVTKKHPDWTLDIFGKGKLMKKLDQQIKQLSIGTTAHLRGNSTNVRGEMLASSGIVMSSRNEGFPMVLLEAAACGLPMVSYDCPCGPSEIIKDGRNGFLVRNHDVEGLAEAICKLIENDRTEMGRCSAETAENYSIDRIMEQWDALFKKAVNTI